MATTAKWPWISRFYRKDSHWNQRETYSPKHPPPQPRWSSVSRPWGVSQWWCQRGPAPSLSHHRPLTWPASAHMGRWWSLNPAINQTNGPSWVFVMGQHVWLRCVCVCVVEDVQLIETKSQVFSTFPFRSCRLISTRSRCHPGLVPLLSCPILIFSMTSPMSSSCKEMDDGLRSSSSRGLKNALQSMLWPLRWTCPLLLSQSRAAALACWHTGASAASPDRFARTGRWTRRRPFPQRTNHWWKSLSRKAQLRRKKKTSYTWVEKYI